MAIQDRSEDRDGYAVRVLAVHSSEGYGSAEDLRDATWWVGSSHAIADETGTLLDGDEDGCVPHERASWTLRSGNRWSLNIELIGWAKWTRAEWLSRPDLLDACARWLAANGLKFNIPLVKINSFEYRQGASGIIGHVDHTVGYADGTHTDPGTGFPWDYVISLARRYQEDDLLPDEKKKLDAIYNALCNPVIQGKTLPAAVRELLARTDEVEPLLKEHAAKHAAPPA
jgi:hypothetical protein